MSFFTRRSSVDAGANEVTYASGPLSELMDVTTAAYEEGRVLYNANAAQIAGEQIYDDVVERVKAATGEDLQNPYRLSFKERYIDSFGPSLRSPYNPRQLAITKARRDFQLRYWKLQQGQREKGVPFDERLPDFHFESALSDLIEERRQRLAAVTSRASGVDAVLGGLAGGLGAAGTDPFTYASMGVPVGGAGRSVLSVAARGAVVNAGIETTLQPVIKSWHDELGLDYTVGQAATNVVFAALFGGALEGGGSATYRAVRGSPEFREARAKLEALPEDHTLKQALSAKRQDVIQAARKLETVLPPEGRAALAREEGVLRANERAPAGVPARVHENALSDAVNGLNGESGLPPQRLNVDLETERVDLQPYLSDAYAQTDTGLTARGLAALSDEAWLAVQTGDVSPELGGKIGRHVEDQRLHAAVARDVSAARPRSAAEMDFEIGQALERRAGGQTSRALQFDDVAPPRPQSLVDWLRDRGGVRDDTPFMQGEVRRVLGGDPRGRPGVVNNKSGETLDVLARAADEDGFDVPNEDPEVLLRLIEEEIAGAPSFRVGEGEVYNAWLDELSARPDPIEPAPPRDLADWSSEADAIDAIAGKKTGKDVRSKVPGDPEPLDRAADDLRDMDRKVERFHACAFGEAG